MTEEVDVTDVKLIELDYAILGVLPDQGTKLGFTALAKQARAVARDLNERLARENPGEKIPKVTSAQINGRLRVLHLGGYVDSLVVQPVGYGAGWQRTPNGVRLLSEHEAEGGPTIPVHAGGGGGTH